MIDLKLVQKQPEVLAKALADRQSPLKVDEFLELDGRRRALLAEVESLKQQQNAASRQVAQIKREGGDASHMMEELGALSARIKALDVQTAEAKAAVENWLMGVPNIPDASVPVGKDETENVEVLRWGTPRQFDFCIPCAASSSMRWAAPPWISSAPPVWPAAALPCTWAGPPVWTAPWSTSSWTSM